MEHPDHTGSSGNPRAPWNQSEAEPWACPHCSAEHDSEDAAEECWLCADDICESCGTWVDGEMRCDRHTDPTPPLDHPLGYGIPPRTD